MENKRTNDTKIYVSPKLSFFCLSDGGPHLLAASTGQFEDMDNGGDLGGDNDSSGSFSDMLWSSDNDLGGIVTGD